MKLVMGNRNAVHSRDGGETVEKMSKGKRATTVEFPEGISIMEAFQTVVGPQGVWAAHATEGAVPAWVASDNSVLAGMVAEQFGGVEVRELEEETR